MAASKSDLVAASKLLSLVLRHDPAALGLTLDPEGWVTVADLVANSSGKLTDPLIRQIVLESDKQRFALSPDGTEIRANQGHSVEVNLGLQAVIPPDQLFHGTADGAVASIMTEGLTPRQRQFVHLSADRQTALKVGGRHGRPVVLTIAALQMQRAGHCFFLSANGVWLTKAVPTSFIALA